MLDEIDASLDGGLKVLIHCNHGQSRAPTLALLWMHGALQDWQINDFDKAVEGFKAIYPDYAPARGMLEYARAHW